MLSSSYDLSPLSSDEFPLFDVPSILANNWRQRSLTGFSLGITAAKIVISPHLAEGENWTHLLQNYDEGFNQLQAIGPAWEDRHDLLPSSLYPSPRNHIIIPLPDQAVVEEFVLAYETSAVRYMFPVADMAVFRQLVMRTYQEPHSEESPAWLASKACIFSFICFCCAFSLQVKSLPIIDEAVYAQEAFRLLPYFVYTVVNLDSLQAIITLVCPPLLFCLLLLTSKSYRGT
jgi:hypothetical protein